MTSKIVGAKIRTNVYEHYAEIVSAYTFSVSGGDCEFFVPFAHDGVICGLSAFSDGKPLFSSKAMNLREFFAMPGHSLVTLSEISGDNLRIMLNFPAKCEVKIEVTTVKELMQYAGYVRFTLPKSEYASVFETEFIINIYGKIQKILSPANRITTTVSEKLCRVLGIEKSNMDLILDIFYEEMPENRLLISRHPLQKSVALCSFTASLPSLNSKRTDKFDIHIAFSTAKVFREVHFAATVFLNCLKPTHLFRLNINGETRTDFAPATAENIDRAINILLDSEYGGSPNPQKTDANTVIICNYDAISDNLYEDALVFLTANGYGVVPFKESLNYIIISTDTAGDIIPLEFTKFFEPTLSPALLSPVGGMNTELFPCEIASLRRNAVNFCFAEHNIIPPKGIRISDKDDALIEEIEFSGVDSQPQIRAIDVMYARELIRYIEKVSETDSPEEICIHRDMINQLCLKNSIAKGDIALVCTTEDGTTGYVAKRRSAGFENNRFCEKDKFDKDKIIGLILKSQTIDGAVADISVYQPGQLIFSTAVCLIALYLYTGNTYRGFAMRSLEFLRDRGSFLAQTATELWNGEKIDFEELLKKLDMKIMYERVDELAIHLIKNYSGGTYK